MKYLLSTSVLVLFMAFSGIAQTNANPQTSAPAASTPDPNGPKSEFESEVIDYGTIQQYADGVRHFKFKNTGKNTRSCERTPSISKTEYLRSFAAGPLKMINH